jgi:hypothetical protein
MIIFAKKPFFVCFISEFFLSLQSVMSTKQVNE